MKAIFHACLFFSFFGQIGLFAEYAEAETPAVAVMEAAADQPSHISKALLSGVSATLEAYNVLVHDVSPYLQQRSDMMQKRADCAEALWHEMGCDERKPNDVKLCQAIKKMWFDSRNAVIDYKKFAKHIQQQPYLSADSK